jgi:hypothetical protein
MDTIHAVIIIRIAAPHTSNILGTSSLGVRISGAHKPSSGKI